MRGVFGIAVEDSGAVAFDHEVLREVETVATAPRAGGHRKSVPVIGQVLKMGAAFGAAADNHVAAPFAFR